MATKNRKAETKFRVMLKKDSWSKDYWFKTMDEAKAFAAVQDDTAVVNEISFWIHNYEHHHKTKTTLHFFHVDGKIIVEGCRHGAFGNATELIRYEL